MRFRLGALPNFRGMVNPSLGPSPAPRGTSRQKAEKYALAIRFPESGGEYVYLRAGYGEQVAFLYGVALSAEGQRIRGREPASPVKTEVGALDVGSA